MCDRQPLVLAFRRLRPRHPFDHVTVQNLPNQTWNLPMGQPTFLGAQNISSSQAAVEERNNLFTHDQKRSLPR